MYRSGEAINPFLPPHCFRILNIASVNRRAYYFKMRVIWKILSLLRTFSRPQKTLVKLCVAALFLIAAGANADEARFLLLPAGAAAKLGGFIPQHLILTTTKPGGIRQVPASLVAPLYGEFHLGPAELPAIFFVIVDEPQGKPARLFVDANGNGDFTDDPPIEWQPKTNHSNGRDLVSYSGAATFKVPYDNQTVELRFPLFRLDKNDPQHPGVGRMLFYYSDYARVGTLNLGGKAYSALLSDRLGAGDFRPGKDPAHPSVILFIDVNGDGKFDLGTEAFRTDRPLRVAEGYYVLTGMTAAGDSFQIIKTAAPADEVNAVAGLKKGNRALAFAAKTTAGGDIKFPASYQGKLVLLDFWATWCPPCREELPHISAAYQQLHARGFDILSVSLDQADNGDALAQFTRDHNMPWPEIYDGKYWQARVAQLYQIDSIPHAFLVDGDTGLIIAEGDSLRGDALAGVIEKALAKRSGR
jgi:thiol-disulfide isomerase/thioredoxin